MTHAHRVLADLTSVTEPFFTRRLAPDKVVAFATAVLSWTPSKSDEFPIVAACFALEELGIWAKLLTPKARNTLMDKIEKHWAVLEPQTHRPGYNDFFITVWLMKGEDIAVKNLCSVLGNYDARGQSAQWAIRSISLQQPLFAQAYARVMGR